MTTDEAKAEARALAGMIERGQIEVARTSVGESVFLVEKPNGEEISRHASPGAAVVSALRAYAEGK